MLFSLTSLSSLYFLFAGYRFRYLQKWRDEVLTREFFPSRAGYRFRYPRGRWGVPLVRWVSFSIPTKVEGRGVDTRIFPLMYRVSFSIPARAEVFPLCMLGIVFDTLGAEEFGH